ncbi:MAG: hypothetical protein RIQ52_1819 [Pseudomonadota bacterium]
MNRPFLSIAAIALSTCLLCTSHEAPASVPLAPRQGPGGKMDMYGCMQSNDYYVANFAAFQMPPVAPGEARQPPTAQCLEIARTGNTQITLDLLDRDVRNQPVVIRVLDQKGKVLSETAPTVVKQGVTGLSVDFPTPGHYETVLYVQHSELNIPQEVSALHIPLLVATAPAVTPVAASQFGKFVLLTALAVLAMGFALPRLLRQSHNNGKTA